MSGSNTTIGIEGVSFNTAYTAYTTTTGSPEYPGLPFAAGTRVNAGNGGEWIFVVASGTVTANDVCVISDHAVMSCLRLADGTAKGRLGRIAGIAGASATVNQGFWLQVAGYAATINVATGSAAWTVLSSTSTVGRLGAAAAGVSAKVNGIVILATAASNTAAAILNFPAIGTDD